MRSTPVRTTPPAVLAALLLVGLPVTGRAAAPWLDPAWSRRVLFSVEPDSIEGTGTLTDFPMLVQLDSRHAAVFGQASSDGRDLRFTTADGVTLLDAEIVRYDTASQRAEIWVRAAILSKTANQFFMYYNNPLAPSASTSDVWADYKAVYHFEQDPVAGTLLDSSPAQAHAVTLARDPAVWTSSDLVAAKIGHGWHYDTNKTVNTNGITVATPAWTISAWLEHDTHSTDFFTQADPCYFQLSSQTSDVSRDVQYNGGYCGAPPDFRWRAGGIVLNEWHHFAWVYDGPSRQITFYYDGTRYEPYNIYPEGAEVYEGHTLNPDGNQLVGVLGPMYSNGLNEMNGTGDEFRVRPGAVTSAWLRTEVRNQNAPARFLDFGPQELAGQARSWGGIKSRY